MRQIGLEVGGGGWGGGVKSGSTSIVRREKMLPFSSKFKVKFKLILKLS